MTLSQKQKKVLRWVGYPMLALFTFVLVLHLTFPYDRVVDRFVVESLEGRYQVSYLSVERGILPGNVTVRGLALSSLDADEADDDGTNLYFKEVSLELGILALIRGRADVEFVAKLGDGSIRGNVQASRAELETHITTSALPLGSIGGVRSAVGLPMEGGLNATIDLTMPKYRWDNMNGRITLACPGCTIGDGKTKLAPRAPSRGRISRSTMAFASEGLTVPQLALGDLAGTMTIEDGRGSIDDFSAQSEDGEMALQAVVRFTRSIGQSRFESGCMKFRLSESLKEREKQFGNLPNFMRISPEPDGFSNVKLQGLVKAMRWIPTRKCSAGGDDEPEERVARPRVTQPRVTPESGVPPKPPKPAQPDELEPSVRTQELELEQGDAEPKNGNEVTLPEPRSSGPPLARPPRISDDIGSSGANTGLQAVGSTPGDEEEADENTGDPEETGGGEGDPHEDEDNHDQGGEDRDEEPAPGDGATFE